MEACNVSSIAYRFTLIIIIHRMLERIKTLGLEIQGEEKILKKVCHTIISFAFYEHFYMILWIA